MRRSLRHLTSRKLRSSPSPSPSRSFHLASSSQASAAVARKPEPRAHVDDFGTDVQDEAHSALYPSWDELGLTEDIRNSSPASVEEEGPKVGAGTLDDVMESWVEQLGAGTSSESDVFRAAEGDAARMPQWEEMEDVLPELRKQRPKDKDKGKGKAVAMPRVDGASRPEVKPVFVEESYRRPTTAAVPSVPLSGVFVDSPIEPYLPVLALSTPPQPHDFPLVSRYDWRLSSPVHPRRPTYEPPDLFEVRDVAKQGHNKLVGIGLEPTREARRWRALEAETWGWKVRVPDQERAGWTSCDAYRKGPDRLIALSRNSDEKRYLALLDRLGTPEEREFMGRTANNVVGSWLGETALPGKVEATMERAAELQKKGGTAGSLKQASVVSVWGKASGELLGPEQGYKFTQGTILRFTPTTPADNSSGPRPPPSAVKRHPQGQLLEFKDGQLIVAFDEMDVWAIGDGEYRIDIGLDDSSYAIQSRALDNLYYDPTRQRTHNALHVAGAQEAFRNGTTTTLREWTLQGTDLRELLVPDLDATEAAAAASSTTASWKEEDELWLDSPAAELARLSTPPVPVVQPAPVQASNPSTLFSENQLINSWIRRHQREPPMGMVGDPELGLNESQTKAVAMALGEKLSLIQGPPGTGKSQTIVSIIHLLKSHFRIPQPILLAAPTHVSVDHLLSLLVNAGLNPLRTGKAVKVRPELQKWTIEQRQEKHPLWKKTEEARNASETFRKEMVEYRDRAAQGKIPAAEAEAEIAVLMDKYRSAWRRFIWFEQRLYSSLIASADVFCATAIGSGSSKVMNMIDFPIVFLDEAAMCTEPVSLIPIMKGSSHVTFIGDHKQLPAVVSCNIAKRERLHISLFERLMSQRSVKSVLLDTQYRMRPAISALPNQAFYFSALQDSPLVTSRPPPPRSRFLTQPPTASAAPATTAFITHDHPETFYRQSIRNAGEAAIIVQLVGDLLKQNITLDAGDIGVISPYAAQTRHLVDLFESGDAGQQLYTLLGPHRAEDVARVEVNTVDGFQGREKAVIILSTVRSNKTGQIGFLTDKRRLNVALTRAKDALLVVGNARTLKAGTMSDFGGADVDADAGIWRKYLLWMEERGLVRKWDDGGGGT